MSGYPRMLSNREWLNARLREIEGGVDEANRRATRTAQAPDFGAGPTFVPLALQNGWLPFSDTWQTPRAWVRDGVVHLDGMIRGGTVAVGTVLFTLPVGMRPIGGTVLLSVDWDGAMRSLSVTTAGVVIIHTTSSTGTYISLSNVRFPILPDYVAPAADMLAGYSSYGGSFRAVGYNLDSFGFIRPFGLLRGTTIQPDNTLILRLPPSANVRAANQRHIGIMAGGGATGIIGLSRELGGIVTKTGTLNAAWQLLDGPVLGTPASLGFTDATLENDWTRRATDDNRFPKPGFCKRPDGIVVLQGLCRDGLVGATVFTLPEGHRPAMALRFMTAADAAPARVDVFPDGRVHLVTGAPNAWLSFDGLSFYGEV